MRHPDYNGFENAEYNGKEPFKIYGPGSYEINGNLYVGYGSEAKRNESDFIKSDNVFQEGSPFEENKQYLNVKNIFYFFIFLS